jgi:proteasome lid subunit RPN8/RPN11
MGKGKVIIDKATYRLIVASCVRFANARIPEDDWGEIYGILIGYIDKRKNIIVKDAYAITHTMEKNFLLKVSYDNPDYVDAALIEEEAYTRDPPQFIVGWFHSHPGIKVMFSTDDIKNQLGFQSNNPHAFGLVFNHVRLVRQVEIAMRKGDPVTPLSNDLGFKVFRLKDATKGRQASYVEVDFEIKEENITPQFIEEAKNLVADVTRLMPTGNLVEYTRENMEQQKAKVKDVFTGTESYVKTLLKKGDTARIANVIVQQEKELEKIIQPMNEDFQKLSELMFYVEYKERGETINGINKLIQEWNEYTTHIKSEFDKIKTRF